MSSARAGRSAPLNFLAFLATVLGALLLLVSQRPELRGRPGQEQASAAPVVAAAGHGMTWGGAAFLLVRAAIASRTQGGSAPTVEVITHRDAGTGGPPTA